MRVTNTDRRGSHGPQERGSGYHQPVMVEEVLGFLRPTGDALFFDGTLGGGGHTREILATCAGCRVIGVDRDGEALEAARASLSEYGDRVRFVRERFDRALDDPEIADLGLDGALLDLGVSSRQLDADQRGFAFRRGVALDMRMDSAQDVDALRFLAEATESTLFRVFRDLGEEPRAGRLAREIIKRRQTRLLETSDDLVAALSVSLGRAPSMQDKARIFQAVRIAVNDELESLERALPDLRDALKDGGVMVVIAYHSLEDRLVKNAFREWSRACGIAWRDALHATLRRGEQAILFLNRRGHSRFVVCPDCREPIQCKECDVSLVLHRSAARMICHLCGHEQDVPQRCPHCQGAVFRFLGFGTERVEDELRRVAPRARVVRMDSDTTGTRGAHERILSAFGQGEIDVLVGTQMIRQGPRLPKVTLVGHRLRRHLPVPCPTTAPPSAPSSWSPRWPAAPVARNAAASWSSRPCSPTTSASGPRSSMITRPSCTRSCRSERPWATRPSAS